MIRLNQQIRLDRCEVVRLKRITGIDPGKIRTLDEFDAYIRRCRTYFWGVSQETRFIHWLIDRERARCLGLPWDKSLSHDFKGWDDRSLIGRIRWYWERKRISKGVAGLRLPL
jgi:hypothetical protein